MATETYMKKSDGWYSFKDNTKVNFPTEAAASTQFGFNIIKSSNSYTQEFTTDTPPVPVNENATHCVTRLVTDYGNFRYGKVFYSNFVGSAWDTGLEGLSPMTDVVVCMTWTLGSIANGSHDSVITSYAQSVPAGKRAMLCWNESDYKMLDGTISSSTTFKADMDHLYDLLHSLTLTGKCEAWYCFGEYNIDPASGPAWSDSFINTAKCDGIVWDCYWNQTTDVSGATKLGYIAAKNTHLGITNWILGESGDRRPQDEFTPTSNLNQTGRAVSDSSRASTWNTRLATIVALQNPPQAFIYFNTQGTSGDHRIYTGHDGGGGPDVLMCATLGSYIAAARGE
jgi:hypothetical protein